MNDKYRDIMDLPHYVSKKYRPMSMDERASQFAPFAALTGYGEAINETKRLTYDKIILSDEMIEVSNHKLSIINDNITNISNI